MTSAVAQRTVGRYEIVGELGRGATSVVHLARQVDLDRFVALKELIVLRAADPQVTERFLLESRLAGSLTHPNIVTVYEYFEDGGAMFIAMEYLERGSLRPLVGMLSLAQTGGVLDGLLAGLAHAHGRGVVHRDLKPENVLVTAAGGVKIADFGIAKALGRDSRVTTGGATIGTPAYMAPEQAISSEVGPAADLYAVGVIAYELLAGDVPFHGSDVAMAVMLEHLNAPVPPLREARPDLSDEVCTWVEDLLAKEPSARPASAADAAELLDEALLGSLGPRWRRASRLETAPDAAAAAQGAVATARTRPAWLASPEQARRRTRRRVAFAAAGVAAVAVAAGGLALASSISDGHSEATSTPRETTEEPPAKPVVRVPTTTLASIRGRATETGAVATIRFTGDPVAVGRITVRDGDLSDGHAWLVIRQKGVASRVKRASAGPLAAWVRTARNLVRVDLSAAAGAYESIRVRRANGRTVVVTAVKPPPAPPATTGGTTSPSGPSPTTGTTTTPPPATTTTETQPPPWATG